MLGHKKSSPLTYDFIEFITNEYVANRDVRDTSPLVTGDGESQRDPDNPNMTQELINALKDIVNVAQNVLNKNKSVDSDKVGNKDKDIDGVNNDQNDVINRPKADSPASIFGEE